MSSKAGLDIIWDDAYKDMSETKPNLYIMSHGHIPSTTMKITPTIYEYKTHSDFSIKIPAGFIFVFFTPPNMQMWQCDDHDKEFMNTDWYSKDWGLYNNAKFYFPGDECINMGLQFDDDVSHNIFKLRDGSIHKSNKHKYIKNRLFKTENITLKYMFDELNKSQTNDTSNQIIYLMACNPYQSGIENTITNNISKEYRFVNDMREKLETIGRTNFLNCRLLSPEFSDNTNSNENVAAANNGLVPGIKRVPKSNRRWFSRTLGKKKGKTYLKMSSQKHAKLMAWYEKQTGKASTKASSTKRSPTKASSTKPSFTKASFTKGWASKASSKISTTGWPSKVQTRSSKRGKNI